MARSIPTSLPRLIAASTLLAACALLGACSHTPNGAASASNTMSSHAALGPVYFGDVMSFGQQDAAPAAPVVTASITLEY